MRIALIIIILLVSATASIAQTKKIAYKSHSGSKENFSYTLSEGLFDIGESNFGHAPQPLVRDAMLDSVIFVSDTLAIMVTSEYCTRRTSGGNGPKAKATLWKAGREEVRNHPLFSRNHCLDSIKSILKRDYNFRNPVEKVVFVGFDNEEEKKYKSFESLPVQSGPGNSSTPFGGAVILITGLIVVLSVFGGWLAWKRAERKPVAI